jgi:hypothetical protein
MAHRSRLFLCVPRVVRRVQVINGAGTSPAQLDDRLARCPSKMLHSSGHEKIAPGRHCLTGAGVELFAHADIKYPGNHRDMLRLWMGMRGDFVSIRKLEAFGVEAFLARISLQHRPFRSGGKGGRTIGPNDIPGQVSFGFSFSFSACAMAAGVSARQTVMTINLFFIIR